MTDNKVLQIDIHKLFRNKNPRLTKLIPGFVFRFISKTLHETEINATLRESETLTDIEFTKYVVFEKLKVKVESTGSENIPKTGGAIIVCNHPLGGLDGMILMTEAAKVRPDVRVIVNDLLTEIPNFGEIFIGVNKLGSKARNSLQKVDEAYAEGKLVLVFPAGLCSRKIRGRIQDLEWQKSFISRAQKYNLPIIPAFFSGKNSNRFYNIANWRKFFRVKANVEMFYLVDEMFRQNGKTFKITFGKPISVEQLSKKHTAVYWAEKMRKFVYTLESNPNASFDEFHR